MIVPELRLDSLWLNNIYRSGRVECKIQSWSKLDHGQSLCALKRSIGWARQQESDYDMQSARGPEQEADEFSAKPEVAEIKSSEEVVDKQGASG